MTRGQKTLQNKMKQRAPCLVVQTIKNLLAMQETHVQFLSWKDPWEKGMATLSIVLAWRIPMDRVAWWATVHGVKRNRT